MNTRICKTCSQAKERTRTSQLARSGKPIHLDADGLQWYGLECNSCHNKKSKAMRDKDAPPWPELRTWNKRCTFCKEKLKYPRYYYHIECFDGANIDDLSSIYGVSV